MPFAQLGVRGGVRCQRRTWGFVEGSDASGALGGSWRGRMPAAHLGVSGGVGCQRQIIPLCVSIVWLDAWKSIYDANRPKNVCFNGLLADADPCRLCRDVYLAKLG